MTMQQNEKSVDVSTIQADTLILNNDDEGQEEDVEVYIERMESVVLKANAS